MLFASCDFGVIIIVKHWAAVQTLAICLRQKATLLIICCSSDTSRGVDFFGLGDKCVFSGTGWLDRALFPLFAKPAWIVHRGLLRAKRWNDLFGCRVVAVLLLLHHDYLLIIQVASFHDLVVVYIEFDFLVAYGRLLSGCPALYRGGPALGHVVLAKHQLGSQLDGCIALILACLEADGAFVVAPTTCRWPCLVSSIVRCSCTAARKGLGRRFLGWGACGCGCNTCCVQWVGLEGSKRTRLLAIIDEGRDCLLLLLLTRTRDGGAGRLRPCRLLRSSQHWRLLISRNFRLLDLLLLLRLLLSLLAEHGSRRSCRLLSGVVALHHLHCLAVVTHSRLRRVSQRATRHNGCILLLLGR